MKKCSAVCLYNPKENNVLNFSVLTKTGHIELIKNRKFDSFKQLYAVVVKTAQNNGYCIKYWADFGALFYDIHFVDIETGKVDYYAYPDSLHCE